ncbi:hypothetical protein [Acetanaerobacterium elongatum]|uniref:Lipoprotein n=1 Tax=Acetanaerobacterium elongatum TaxID=258515 RepID=A0A1G9V5X7_9FIRM|nr:hypothetical protein [Acetanaerobacterium elongatum]SDM67493.1 hypothetical protein SAMN05192585_10360 [Acetanaerobacterium elongatum]
MKKLLGLILTALLLFSGCAQQGAAQSSQPAENQKNTKGATASQLAENQTRVYGKIQEINGNEIVLAVGTMKMPVGASGNMQPGGSGNMKPGESGNGKNRPDFGNGGADAPTPPDGQAPQGDMTTPDGKTRPSGGMPGLDNQGGQNNTASGSSGGKTGRGSKGGGMPGGTGGGFSVELTYTGETKTLQIPVGLKITTGMGANAKESDFTALAKDNVIAVVLEKSSDGTEKVVSVRLMS